MSTPPTGGPSTVARRAPILVVVVVALVAGLVAGGAHAARTTHSVPPVDATQRSSPRALSTAWYCPGLPAAFPTGNQTVTLSNLGSADANAIVTVQPDDGSSPVVRTESVAAHTVRTFSRRSLSVAPGPLVVEPFSPDVVVEAGVESSGSLDVVPCATSASADWYFAAGTTVRGVKEWLVLDDPFSTDARVDVTVRTDSGLLVLPGLQGVDVPGRSRVVMEIDNQAVRQARVSLQVHASVGRVVAAQTLDFGPTSGATGVATSFGAFAPASQWWFTDGKVLAGATQWVAIANVSEVNFQVFVTAILGSAVLVSPVVITAQSGGVSWVQIGNCARTDTTCLRVPSQNGYELEVQADQHQPIVAQTLSRFSRSKVALGATTSMGSTTPAREWVIARTRARDERSTSISVMNTSVKAARVNVAIVHDGVVDRPDSLQDLTIAPNSRLVLPVDPAVADVGDAAVVIDSDQPILAESTMYAQHDATRAPGIPTR